MVLVIMHHSNALMHSFACYRQDLAPLHDCAVVFPDEIYAIEPAGSQKNIHLDGVVATPTKRKPLTL